jgi:dipeptidyl aminopeptidase/acylaminoacyl peptidase
MKRRAVLMCILLVSSVMLTTAAVSAKKPENPGGGGSDPTGTIFYNAPDENGVGYVWTMDADGSNKVKQLTDVNYYDDLSWEKHNGKYWYLATVEIDGETHPDGWTRNKVQAYNDDKSVTVTLLNDANYALHRTNWCGCPRWMPGDDYITWAGKTWTDNGDGTYTESDFGIYKAEVSYAANGDVNGIGTPSFVYDTGSVVESYDGLNYADVRMFDWNPSCNKVVYQPYNEGNIYIDSVPAGSSPTLLVSGSWPTWSPDGGKIGFYRNDEILVINVDGTGLDSLVTVKTTKGAFKDIMHFTFSPDGKYIVYTLHERNRQTWAQKTYMYTMGTDGKDNSQISGFDSSVWKCSREWR